MAAPQRPCALRRSPVRLSNYLRVEAGSNTLGRAEDQTLWCASGETYVHQGTAIACMMIRKIKWLIGIKCSPRINSGHCLSIYQIKIGLTVTAWFSTNQNYVFITHMIFLNLKYLVFGDFSVPIYNFELSYVLDRCIRRDFTMKLVYSAPCATQPRPNLLYKSRSETIS